MIRGTTPTITMRLPGKVAVGSIDKAIVSIEQSGKEVIRRDSSDMTADKLNNTLAVKLTQEETLSLSAKNKACVQLKVKLFDGTVLASLPTPIAVIDVVNKEKML